MCAQGSEQGACHSPPVISSGHQTQLVQLHGKHLQTLNYLTGPAFCFVNVTSRKVKSHMLLHNISTRQL